VGKRIETTGNREWMTIVGVVSGIKHISLAEEKQPHIYMALAQYPDQRAAFVVRTDGPPNAAISTFRAAISQTLSTQRLTNILLTAFAILALTLAAVGIYSTMSLYVGSRTKEFGIKLALGAQPGALRRGVMRQGLLLTGAGVLVGIAGALALTRTIKSLLFEVSAMIACYRPARRATQVDPLIALRNE
jgi:putative ABC transport system permease protein